LAKKRSLEEEKEPTEQTEKIDQAAGRRGGWRKGAGLLMTPPPSYVLLPSEFPRIEFAGNSSQCIKIGVAEGYDYY